MEQHWAKLQSDTNQDADIENLRNFVLETENQNLILKMAMESNYNSQETNTTVDILKTENEQLTQKLSHEKEKCRILQQKLKIILKNQELFIQMKEEYLAMLKSVQENKLRMEEDKSTTTSYCTVPKEESSQINMECEQCLKNNWLINPPLKSNVSCQVDVDVGSDVVPRRYVLRLQDDINTLKVLLNEREAIWGKLATRERVQRLHLHRIQEQLEDLQQLEFKQRVELELKNKRVEELTKDLEVEKTQVRKLKKNKQ